MKFSALIFALLPAWTLAGCTTAERAVSAPFSVASLTNSQGQPVGSARLFATGDGMMLTVDVMSMPAGIHGIHIHATGKCDAPAFTTAAGHLNPAGHQHGSMNSAGPHLGDLPNLVVSEAGTGTIAARIPGTVSELEAQLFDMDGTAIVVHAGPDDYKTDPSGNSGGRIACGVLTRA